MTGEVSGLPLPTQDPVSTPETEPFWAAADDGRLALPRCLACGSLVWYPRSHCPTCHADALEWVDLPGTGEVYSYTIVREAHGEWRDAVPYVIASVELDPPEGSVWGPRMLTNLVDVAPEAVVVGMVVEVVFHHAPGGRAVPRFRPAPVEDP